MTVRSILFSFLFLATLVACNKAEAPGSHADESSLETATTRIAHTGGMKVVADLETLQQHKKMMESMDMAMEHSASASHVITVTLLDEKSDSQVEDADVKVTLQGPGMTETTAKGAPMSGHGMFHYGAEFTIPQKGTYTATISITRGGESHTAEVAFEIK